MDNKQLLNEIINLKERRHVLEAECGTVNHNMNIFSKKEVHQMEDDMENMNTCVALSMVNSMIERDEEAFRRGHGKTHRW